VSCAYLAMMVRFEEVSAAQQRMVAGLSRPSRPNVEWMKDQARGGPNTGELGFRDALSLIALHCLLQWPSLSVHPLASGPCSRVFRAASLLASRCSWHVWPPTAPRLRSDQS